MARNAHIRTKSGTWVGLDGYQMGREPELGDAYLLAAGLREALGGIGTTRPSDVIERAGWRWRHAELSAPANGDDALLLPLSRGGFEMVVDPRLAGRESWMLAGAAPGEAAQTLVSTIEFRLGHEFAHTLFYVDGAPPVRRRPFSREEELFCDAFARAMIVPSARLNAEAKAAQIVHLAATDGVSLELAAGAVSDRYAASAFIGGIRNGERAQVHFFTGVPHLPGLSQFQWERDHWSRPEELHAAGLYWPIDAPEIALVDSWTDGNRFLLGLELNVAGLASAAA